MLQLVTGRELLAVDVCSPMNVCCRDSDASVLKSMCGSFSNSDINPVVLGTGVCDEMYHRIQYASKILNPIPLTVKVDHGVRCLQELSEKMYHLYLIS